MKQYKKPLMKIVELEKVDVLTCSCTTHNGVHSDCEIANFSGCNHKTLSNDPGSESLS